MAAMEDLTVHASIQSQRGVPPLRPRLAIDVGGVISVAVDTDNNGISTRDLLESTSEALSRTAPTLECAEAVRLLVEHFGPDDTFVLSKCKRPTQLATMEFLSRSMDGGGSFFERTGLRPHNVLFCTRRSGGDHSLIDGGRAGLMMESLSCSKDDGSGGGGASGARVAVGHVGKGAVARKFGLTHFIDDREECLLSDMFEGYLMHPHLDLSMSEEIDGMLVQFGQNGTVPDRSRVDDFLDSHGIHVQLVGEVRERAVDDCLAKWTVAEGWEAVLKALGIWTSLGTFERRLTPKVPPGWADLSADQKRVYESLVQTINQPTEIVDEQYDAIPDSFGGRVIGTDAARELSEEYKSSWEGALLYSQVTSGPASAYAQDRFRREIEKEAPPPPPSQTDSSKVRRVLVLTAGGPASGKTSVVRSDLVDGTVDLVMDQNLGKYARAIEQIELAVANDWDVKIVYVFKPFDLVAAKVFDRANKHGRWAPASVVGQAHVAAQESVLKLYDRYMRRGSDHDDNDETDRDSACVQVKLMENLHSKDNPVPCAEISVDVIRPGGKYYLGDRKEWIEETIRDALQAAKESGKIEPRLMAAMEFGTNPATGK